jgi:integrase
MAGYVRTNEKCPICGGPFVLQLAGRVRVMLCPEHKTSPRTVYLDTSGFGLKKRKRYRGLDRKVFPSTEAACQLLGAMRLAKSDPATWDPADWEEREESDFLFGEAWERYVEVRSRKWSAAYKIQVDGVYKRFLEKPWGKLDIRHIRNGHLMDLEEALREQGRKPSYIKLVFGVAMGFFGYLKHRGDIKVSLDMPEIEVPTRDLWILDGAQQEAIISKVDPHDQLILRLQAQVGVRPCEVCSLRARDIVGGSIFFQRSIDNEGNVRDRTKRNKVYRKPVPADLAEAIAEQLRDKLPEAWLFLNRRGHPYRPGHLARIWRQAARAAGFAGVPLNVGTRHSFATRTWREEEAAARRRTADAVGHGSPSTTFRHYVGGEVREIPRGSATDSSRTTENQ